MKLPMQSAIDQADEAVMALCTPDRMEWRDAILFLQGVSERIDGAIEALREENTDDDEGE